MASERAQDEARLLGRASFDNMKQSLSIVIPWKGHTADHVWKLSLVSPYFVLLVASCA